MATTEEFFAFVKKHYDLELEHNSCWALISDGVHTDNTHNSFINSFAHTYWERAHLIPNVKQKSDPLFMKIMEVSINKGVEKYEYVVPLENLFKVWTENGTRIISDAQAARLGTALLRLFNENSIAQDYAMAMVLQSEKLWPFLEQFFLEAMQDTTNPERHSTLFKIITFRYIPDHHDFKEYEIRAELYEAMCGSDVLGLPALLNLRHVLKGPHNNALAWTTALLACNRKAMFGQWMHMRSIFSLLELNPQDPQAWRFWDALCTCTKDDYSGKKLIQNLEKKHAPISRAYLQYWPIIVSIEEGDARFVRASQVSRDLLPILSIDSLDLSYE